jgi:hypothetical protein
MRKQFRTNFFCSRVHGADGASLSRIARPQHGQPATARLNSRDEGLIAQTVRIVERETSIKNYSSELCT